MARVDARNGLHRSNQRFNGSNERIDRYMTTGHDRALQELQEERRLKDQQFDYIEEQLQKA
jgi:hypothetical protein